MQDALKQRKLVVVVGAGVSMATTRDPLATWKGLLENGIEFCKAWTHPDNGWIRRAEDALEADELLELGSRIARRLREAEDSGLFGKWLRYTVAQLRVERHDPRGPPDQSSGLIDAIWQLRAPVLTTNYDTLIEDATGAGSATTRTPELIQLVLTGSEPRVVGHLHGVWGDADSIVLSEFSYGKAEGKGDLPTALRSAAYTMSLLFVGCGGGIQDPTFDALRRWLFKELRWSTRSHFLLERGGPTAIKRQAELDPDPINVISYGDEHKDLEGYIRRELVPAARAGFDPSRSASFAFAIAQAVPALTGVAPGWDDAMAGFEHEANGMRRQLARVHSVLRQLSDRLSEPPPDWPAQERTERHRFYAAAASLAAEWLAPEVGLLQQSMNAIMTTVGDLVAAARAGHAPTAEVSSVATASAVADEASATAEAAQSCLELLQARRRESREWAPLDRSLSGVVAQLTGDLERLGSMMDDLRNAFRSDSD